MECEWHDWKASIGSWAKAYKKLMFVYILKSRLAPKPAVHNHFQVPKFPLSLKVILSQKKQPPDVGKAVELKVTTCEYEPLCWQYISKL